MSVFGSGDYDRKKKNLVVRLGGCAVVSVFGSGGKSQFFCCGGKVLLQPEKKGCDVVSVFGSGRK